MIDWSKVRHFTPAEFNCPDGSTRDCMDEELVYRLDAARTIAGVPFVITTAFRAGDPLAHGRGYAVDIRGRSNEVRERIAKALIAVGIPRIGVYNLHLHADTDATLPPGIWGGCSS